MPAFKGFEFTVSFKPGGADDKWIAGELASLARSELRAVQAAGTGSDRYVRAVNGRLNAAEESVRPPGPIVYSFDWVRDATVWGRAWLQVSAPVLKGDFRKSFIVVSEGRELRGEGLPGLRLGAPTLIVNTMPYARKIQVGARGFETYRGLFDVAARRVRAEFRGVVAVRVKFVALSDAYRLKHSRGRGRDRRRGASITYPAIEIISETVTLN